MIYLGRLVAIVLSVVAFPLHLLICACIRMADGAPALYRSTRLGLNGVTFEMLKYRTMAVRCDAVVRADFKTIVHTDDPRVTPVGRYLRCGFDEFAQVVNILRGDMAWVGPRPDEAWMLSNYGRLTRERLLLAPGVTGFAQVLNSRECSTAEAYAIDVWYGRHRTPLLDLWVVCVTPMFILGWRSVGQRRLEQLRACGEFQGLRGACERELAEAAKRESGMR